MNNRTELPLWRRIWGRRRSRRPALDPADPALRVVAWAADDLRSASSVLEEAGAAEPVWDAAAPALSRHHLSVPRAAVDEAVALAAQDGYERVTGPQGAAAAAEPPAEGACAVVLQRVEVLDVVGLARERSRMAGLAQRAGGRVTGWDALQPR